MRSNKKWDLKQLNNWIKIHHAKRSPLLHHLIVKKISILALLTMTNITWSTWISTVTVKILSKALLCPCLTPLPAKYRSVTQKKTLAKHQPGPKPPWVNKALPKIYSTYLRRLRSCRSHHSPLIAIRIIQLNGWTSILMRFRTLRKWNQPYALTATTILLDLQILLKHSLSRCSLLEWPLSVWMVRIDTIANAKNPIIRSD